MFLNSYLSHRIIDIFTRFVISEVPKARAAKTVILLFDYNIQLFKAILHLMQLICCSIYATYEQIYPCYALKLHIIL